MLLSTLQRGLHRIVRYKSKYLCQSEKLTKHSEKHPRKRHVQSDAEKTSCSGLAFASTEGSEEALMEALVTSFSDLALFF